jgi:hypothetical protein
MMPDRQLHPTFAHLQRLAAFLNHVDLLTERPPVLPTTSQ